MSTFTGTTVSDSITNGTDAIFPLDDMKSGWGSQFFVAGWKPPREDSMYVINATQSVAKTILIKLRDGNNGSGKSGLVPTFQLSKAGGALNTITPTYTDLGNGLYAVALTAANLDTLGEGILRVTVPATNLGQVDALPTEVILEVATAASGGGGGTSGPTLKTQFVSTENVSLVFPPFINKTTGAQYLGTDVITLTIRKPDGTLLASPPTLTFDTGVNLWIGTLLDTNFLVGQWLVMASSNGANTTPQNQIFVWGDYVDDIQEARQAAVGKWKVDPTTKQLYLYEDDGVTIFRTYNLKDSSGAATTEQIFERDPV